MDLLTSMGLIAYGFSVSGWRYLFWVGRERDQENIKGVEFQFLYGMTSLEWLDTHLLCGLES